MPILHVHILKRPVEMKRAMARAVTDAVVKTLGCAADSVTIIIHDIPQEDLAEAGVLRCDRPAPAAKTGKPAAALKPARKR